MWPVAVRLSLLNSIPSVVNPWNEFVFLCDKDLIVKSSELSEYSRVENLTTRARCIVQPAEIPLNRLR